MINFVGGNFNIYLGSCSTIISIDSSCGITGRSIYPSSIERKGLGAGAAQQFKTITASN